jgi:hypothetical protein
MTTDPTMRIVWYGGRAYPVSSHPPGVDDAGTRWHVQTPDGEWHAVCLMQAADAEGNAWRAAMESVTQWLTEHDREIQADLRD